MNAHVRRIDNSRSPLVVSLSLSLFQPSLSRSMRAAHLPSLLEEEAEERQSSGNYGRSYEARPKKRVGKLLPPRPRVETAVWRNRRNGRLLVKAMVRKKMDGGENSDNSFPFSFSFSRLEMRESSRVLKVLGTILHDET